MISSKEISEAQTLLVQVANREAFLQTLVNFSMDENNSLPITITIQKVTVSFSANSGDSYKLLAQVLDDATRRDIDNLLQRVNELLKH